MNPNSEQNQDIKELLRVTQEALNAIRKGEVDALVVKGPKGDQIYSIASPDHPYQIFFENMDEAAVILSHEHIILYGNHSFFEMIGAPSENIIGTSILEFVNPESHGYFIDCILKRKKTKTELLIKTQQQRLRTVLISLFQGIWKESEALCLLMRDITQFKQTQHLIETSALFEKALSETPKLPIGTKSIIRLLYNRLGWEVIVIWLWNKESQILQCLDIAHVDHLNIEAFKTKTRALEAESKELFSEIRLSNRPLWTRDFVENSSFPRRDEAIKDNIHGAFTFPFYLNSELRGIVELFQSSFFEENVDDQMLSLISSLGTSLGSYIERLINDQRRNEFTKALELSPNGIYSTDLKGTILSWSHGAERNYGWTAQEIIGKSVLKLYPDERKDEFEKFVQTFAYNTASRYSQSQRIRKDGKLIWINNGYEQLYDLFGNVMGIIAVEEDITLQKELTDHLTESRERFSSFIEITEDWVWELNNNGHFSFSNMIVLECLGYQVDEILGKSLFYFLPLEDRTKLEDQITNHIKEKQGWRQIILPFIHKNGSCRWMISNAKELLDIHGNLLGFRGTNRDITESKNLERIKNEFISIVSHELRTPLTSICGALSLLTTKKLPPEEEHQLISIAHKNSLRLTELINDTMDIEKLQLGKLKLDFKKLNLRDVILESISSAGIIANKFNVKIVTGTPLPVAEVNGDYWRLVQVMNNLLSNAIKFSPNEGVILVTMEVEEGLAKVAVKDYGQGIPKDFQSKVFQIFSQADSSSRRTSGGTGLGLYISKYIIDAHRGKIHYLTKIAEGTTFFFEIPLLEETEK